jgi:selenocysteine lyase/cysteine desulfurase
VLIENVSSAVNCILRSLPLKKGDKILRLSTAYDMVKYTLNWLIEFVGIEVIVVDVDFPVTSSAQLVESTRLALISNSDVKLW